MSYGRKEDGKDILLFVEDTLSPQEPERSSAPTPASAEPSSSASADPMESAEAYNEETGEINWDCPCLGSMTKPPCGETFKEAFSCFVYSKEEPKGLDCVEKFKAMQDCFRQHPEIYGEEVDDDEEVEKIQESQDKAPTSDAESKKQ